MRRRGFNNLMKCISIFIIAIFILGCGENLILTKEIQAGKLKSIEYVLGDFSSPQSIVKTGKGMFIAHGYISAIIGESVYIHIYTRNSNAMKSLLLAGTLKKRFICFDKSRSCVQLVKKSKYYIKNFPLKI